MTAATPLQIAGDCGRPEASRRRHQLRLELLALLVDGAVPGGLTADAIVLDLATTAVARRPRFRHLRPSPAVADHRFVLGVSTAPFCSSPASPLLSLSCAAVPPP